MCLYFAKYWWPCPRVSFKKFILVVIYQKNAIPRCQYQRDVLKMTTPSCETTFFFNSIHTFSLNLKFLLAPFQLKIFTHFYLSVLWIFLLLWFTSCLLISSFFCLSFSFHIFSSSAKKYNIILFGRFIEQQMISIFQRKKTRMGKWKCIFSMFILM